MTAASVKDNADLDDLMLAMDVVDTLRHQQSLVDHALSADQRDAALTARIREIYQAQGIEVSDDVIANGVKALREERFAYRAPPGGIKTWLAKRYVKRARAYKPLLALLAALGVWWGAHFAFSTLPEQREMTAAMVQYNSQVAELQGETISLNNRLDRVIAQVSEGTSQYARGFRETAEAIKRETRLAVEAAQEIKSKLATQQLLSYQDADDFGEERAHAEANLDNYRTSIASLNQQIATAEHNLRLVHAFETMPRELRDLATAAKEIGAEPAVAALANAASENAIAALKARDIEGAEREKRTLENLIEEVRASYEILIVSQPGEKTGVWRYPEDNNRVRNYYIVVEAVTPQGKRLERAVVSEEDGKTYRVKRWAMRVNEKTFNAIAADKGDDGIVQNKLFGEKPRGYINPTYRMGTTGASIVSW